jgi:hypothetical protein
VDQRAGTLRRGRIAGSGGMKRIDSP